MTREQAAQMIENMPISHECREFFDLVLDALRQPEIVRCKDCKYLIDHYGFMDDGYCKKMIEDYNAKLKPKKDWFCADGERKES